MPESAAPVTSIPPLNDASTKKFFRSIQQRLGRKLARLCMSFCSITWQRPSQTAGTLIRRLQKCEKLVELEFNFVQYAVIAGCPRLEELSLIGTTLTLTQAYNLGIQIRDRWKGNTLRIHVWRTSNDEQQTAEIISMNLLHALKNDSKFETDFIGGYRATVLIRRRKHICSLGARLNDIKTGLPKLLPWLCSSSSELFNFRVNGSSDLQGDMENDNIEEICSTLPPGLRSLFGLTPFDYSIMLAHNWDSNES